MTHIETSPDVPAAGRASLPNEGSTATTATRSKQSDTTPTDSAAGSTQQQSVDAGVEPARNVFEFMVTSELRVALRPREEVLERFGALRNRAYLTIGGCYGAIARAWIRQAYEMDSAEKLLKREHKLAYRLARYLMHLDRKKVIR